MNELRNKKENVLFGDDGENVLCRRFVDRFLEVSCLFSHSNDYTYLKFSL
jgi:hypothetical protein